MKVLFLILNILCISGVSKADFCQEYNKKISQQKEVLIKKLEN